MNRVKKHLILLVLLSGFTAACTQGAMPLAFTDIQHWQPLEPRKGRGLGRRIGGVTRTRRPVSRIDVKYPVAWNRRRDEFHEAALAVVQTWLGLAMTAVVCCAVADLPFEGQASLSSIHVTNIGMVSVETGRPLRELRLLVQGMESKFDRRQVLDLLQNELWAADKGARPFEIENLIWRAREFHPDIQIRQDLQAGIDCLRAGKHAEAEQRFLAVTNADPRFSEGWYRIAQLHYLQGFNHDSLRAAGVAVRLEPNHFAGHALRAMTQVQLGRFSLALVSIEQVNSLLPNQAARFLNLDSCRLSELMHGEQVTDFDRWGLSFARCACLLDSSEASWSSPNFPAWAARESASTPVKIPEHLFEAGLSQIHFTQGR